MLVASVAAIDVGVIVVYVVAACAVGGGEVVDDGLHGGEVRLIVHARGRVEAGPHEAKAGKKREECEGARGRALIRRTIIINEK